MLCEKCHQREVTVFLTECEETTPANCSTQSSALCAECSGFPRLPESLIEKGCHYCGGPFFSMAVNLLEPSEDLASHWVLCYQCARENFRFMQQFETDLLQLLATPNPEAQILQRWRKHDQHMRDWVSRRDAK